MAQPRPDPQAFEVLPPTQVIPEDDEDFLEEGDEGDDVEEPSEERLGSIRERKIVRDAYGPYHAARRPVRREREGVVGPYYEDDFQGPALDEYLAQWDLSDSQKIGLLRTYANFLAAQTRTRPTREKTQEYLHAAAKKQKK